jgi:hypothetical protein
MAEIISVDELNRYAIKYNPVLQELPFDTFEDRLRAIGINFLEVKGERRDVIFERKGGLSRPYKYSTVDAAPATADEIGRTFERILKPEKCFLLLIDHIDNLRNKSISSNDPEGAIPDPVTKQHPLKSLIISTVIKTVAEDNLNAIFPGQRDTENGVDPLDMVDGFQHKIASAIISGEVSVAKGNIYQTGAITNENGFSKLVSFVRAAHPYLRRNGYIIMSSTSLFKCMDALTAELEKNILISYDQFIGYLRQKTDAPKLELMVEDMVGTGDQWVFQMKNNMEVGLNTSAATQFVQTLQPNPKDPNWVGFFQQWEIGTRILHFHSKMFMINDQLNEANFMGGDYNTLS